MFSTLTAIAATFLTTLVTTPDVQAGCGCDKPPPPLADIRPAFSSPGRRVTLFADGLVERRSYKVRFESADGRVRTAHGRAVMKRDFADGIRKLQVVVSVPKLAPGPTSVVLSRNRQVLLTVPAEEFTMLQKPLDLDEKNEATVAGCYQAGVGADGTVYVPVDLRSISQRTIFEGFGKNYPLRFESADIAIYNTQGVLMQLLTPENASIWAIVDNRGAPNSFALTYDRHEFETYAEAHRHEDGFDLDPADPMWHVDGTRHIDHDHLIVAIHGRLRDGSVPPSGMTPRFHLGIRTALDLIGPPASRLIAWTRGCGDFRDALTSLLNPGPIVDPGPLPTIPLPLPTLPLPTLPIPLPTLPIPLPSLSLPLPTLPLPTLALPTLPIPLPTLSLPLPLVAPTPVPPVATD